MIEIVIIEKSKANGYKCCLSEVIAIFKEICLIRIEFEKVFGKKRFLCLTPKRRTGFTMIENIDKLNRSKRKRYYRQLSTSVHKK